MSGTNSCGGSSGGGAAQIVVEEAVSPRPREVPAAPLGREDDRGAVRGQLERPPGMSATSQS
jgi:hypothetical protein